MFSEYEQDQRSRFLSLKQWQVFLIFSRLAVTGGKYINADGSFIATERLISLESIIDSLGMSHYIMELMPGQ